MQQRHLFGIIAEVSNKTFSYHAYNLLWTDFTLVASTNKDTGSTEVLKVNYLGIVTNR